MNLIVAVDQNWGIGKNGGLLFSIPEDMRYFRHMTSGKTVIMGRGTLDSMPGKKPLKNRTNIILSRNKSLVVDGAVVCYTAEKAIKEAEKYPEEVFVIGGESVYRQLLDYCEKAYVTKVYANADADRYFSNLDELLNWKQVRTSEEKVHKGLTFVFCEYENTSVKMI